ncbi:MAG: helix-turn-helix transcriptional regulator [Thermodesulfovibrionales bacterium]|nr:helix-turn-helix transcriptional regulator [Thermodesulfovibrionales bacterium]
MRKRRLDLGLLQIEVARMIGVTESTVWNWEHGREPELKYIPKIIEFLSYVPFEYPEDPIGRLRYFKLVNGLSYERLNELMGKDPE